ncbi:RES family NAD+ phosphorylase [Pseudomonas veronii]|mgnify:CR=1 FL=1|uniref:RES family NAD+ phosphorylase n=1 Tax=Pseudomonas veronii TaxID=76761 RepID=A0A7Y1ABD4_PSEVE|nr:RES family NAD+ phosphorylase [Pseudomonas veronii]MDF3239305.1 RES family NAD+ phosphorylase [Pseudomonas veronii]NMY12662.1 RES family NAD+ phosphorylase [Pseudomonas veronii]
MSGEKEKNQDIEQEIQAVILKHPEVIKTIEKGTPFFRVQPTRYEDPVFYNKASDSRYGDLKQEIGVYYVAGSSEVAIAETFQHGASGSGSPVLFTEIEERSLHQLEADRALKVVDVARAAAYGGRKLRDLVKAKGQGSEGYALPQALSAAIMRSDKEIDGLLYTSTVFPGSASIEGCNLVLFDEREKQLVPKSSKPLTEVRTSNGKTAIQLLVDLKVSVE